MTAFELKYLRVIPMGSSSLRLGVGPGLYSTSLKVDQHYGEMVSVTGDMVGLGFGVSLDLDWGIRLGKRVLFDIYGKGRYASTSHIKGDFQDSYGNRHELGLTVDPNGFVGTSYTEYIGTHGIRWANVDYTGGDVGIGFTWMY
jgi:hypothetical protein